MFFESKPLSLEVWTRVLSRVQAELGLKNEQLKTLLAPVAVNIDSGVPFLNKAETLRGGILSQVDELKGLRLLELLLSNQLQIAKAQTDIPSLTLRLLCLQDIATLLQGILRGLPNRKLAEQDLHHLTSMYAGLKNAGAGDSVLQDRQRIRAQVVEIPIFGAEDAAHFEGETRNILRDIDQLEARLQELRVTTLVNIRLDGALAGVLVKFGIELVPFEQVVPAESSPPNAPAEGVDAASGPALSAS